MFIIIKKTGLKRNLYVNKRGRALHCMKFIYFDNNYYNVTLRIKRNAIDDRLNKQQVFP